MHIVLDNSTKSFKLFKKLALVAAVLALCVVVLGAYVRLNDAGLGCPDWPGCYGALTVPESESAIRTAQTAYPNSTVHVGKAWKEMAHRYLAGTLGLIIVTMVVLGWRAKKEIKTTPWLPTFLVFFIGFQAALGMWTVTMLLKPAIVSSHLLGGMASLAILVWLAHRHCANFNADIHLPNGMKLAIRFSLIILFMQIFLGGWTSTNYAALACTDFPTCHGVWLPPMDFKDAFHLFRELGQNANGGALTLESITAIQWAHRLGAAITLIYLGILALNVLKYRQLKLLAILLLIVLAAQISLGIANLILHLPLLLAVAHNFGAALLVVTLVTLNSKITKLPAR
ncbi:MAG: COX15/CtaA family protein [Methylotenera sp.]|nr:COX15/CtaA family protein [Methylotenera sp.]